jgi:hypothetical protein
MQTAVKPQPAGKVLFAQPQGFWPMASVKPFYEQVLGLSWPIGGPVRIELTPTLVLRAASKGGFYILEKVDGFWRCACDGYYWKKTCRHVRDEMEHEALQMESELIPRGGFKPFLEF